MLKLIFIFFLEQLMQCLLICNILPYSQPKSVHSFFTDIYTKGYSCINTRIIYNFITIIIIIIIIILRVLTPAFADSFPLESEW